MRDGLVRMVDPFCLTSFGTFPKGDGMSGRGRHARKGALHVRPAFLLFSLPYKPSSLGRVVERSETGRGRPSAPCRPTWTGAPIRPGKPGGKA